MIRVQSYHHRWRILPSCFRKCPSCPMELDLACPRFPSHMLRTRWTVIKWRQKQKYSTGAFYGNGKFYPWIGWFMQARSNKRSFKKLPHRSWLQLIYSIVPPHHWSEKMSQNVFCLTWLTEPWSHWILPQSNSCWDASQHCCMGNTQTLLCQQH